jgi:hypothetical protein
MAVICAQEALGRDIPSAPLTLPTPGTVEKS